MYHDTLTQEQARRGEAAQIAMSLTVAATRHDYVGHDPLNFFKHAATVVDLFLDDKLNIEIPSSLLVTDIPEEVASFLTKALANRPTA